MAIKPRMIHIHSLVLLLLGGLLINQGLQLRDLGAQNQDTMLSSSVETLTQQQETLRADLDALSSGGYVTAAQLESYRQGIAEQVDSLKTTGQVHGEWQSLKTDLLALSAEVEGVQKELAELKRKVEPRPEPTAKKTSRQPVAAKPKKIIAPPFSLIGIEYRGGEAFLAVAPTQPIQLSDVQLMRVGDWRGDWRLSSLEPATAGFELGDGRKHTVKLRQERP